MIDFQTKRWSVDNHVEKADIYPQLQEAARLLADGEIIAFPTETVYGLGANALSSAAVQKIFTAKGRPGDNPLIVHIAHKQDVEQLAADIPAKARLLMEAFWPGPLTLILPARPGIAPEVTAGLPTVGIRMPAHPVALALIEQAGKPLAAPSANLSGRPSPTTAEHVYEDLRGRIAGIVDGGPTGVGLESTVVDMTEDPPVILRPGGITREQLEEIIGPVQIDAGLLEQAEKPRSPGMKYRHYAPKGELWIVQAGGLEKQIEAIRGLIRQAKENERTVGVLATRETSGCYPEADVVVPCGSRSDLPSVARHLYEALRSFDEQEVDYILAESFPADGVGMAIMNRLHKAAGHRIYSV